MLKRKDNGTMLSTDACSDKNLLHATLTKLTYFYTTN